MFQLFQVQSGWRPGLLCLVLLTFSCKPDRLPILGERQPVTRTSNGQTLTDTLYHTIPEFGFTNQEGQPVTRATFRNKVYVADFFFTTCPTICPKMRTQMLRVYEKYRDNPAVLILSHSIDPRHDSVPVLNAYAKSMGVSSQKWHLVTGDQEQIYRIGQESYLVTAREDPDEPGGLLHSGAFVLVDTKGRIRGLYDGTLPLEVSKLIKDIEILLEEEPS